MESNLNDVFKSKFNLENQGFYDINFYENVRIGFNFKNKLNNDESGNISLLSISIPNKIFEDERLTRKPLYIKANYGQPAAEGGVYLRTDSIKISDPTDMESRDEYFYDPQLGKLYKGDKEIAGDDLVSEVYSQHIKSTKPILGFFLRMKILFWRELMKTILKILSHIFSFILFLISGDKYHYEYFLQEETVNGVIVSSKFRDIDYKKIEEVSKESKSKRVIFFGLELKRWSVIFYSILHFVSYWFFVNQNYVLVNWWRIFNNNFLTVIYIVLSFWLIEDVAPRLFKYVIRNFSIMSAKAGYRSIKI